MSGHPRRLRFAALFLVVPLVLLLAACGSSSSSSSTSEPSGSAESPAEGSSTTVSEGGSADVSGAEKAVAALEGAVPWKAPGPPIENVASLKGKRLFYIANGLEIPYNAELVEAVEEAAKVVGFEVEVGDAKGSVSEAARLMDQAIGQKFDVIVDEAQTVAQLTAPLKSAKEAGIPVIMSFQSDPRQPTAAEKEAGMSAQLSECYSCAGKALANYVVADSGGEADVVLFSVPEQSVANTEQEGFETELEAKCPACKLKVVALPIAQWQTDGESATSSALKSDPDVNYLFPLYDGVETYMEPAIIASPHHEEIKVVSLNASQGQMEKLAAGETVAAEAGFSIKWTGFATVDQALRLLAGMEPVADSNIGMRMFTPKNIGEIELEGDEATWYGIDVQPKFEQLWGIGG
jgi:ribose transport system substrate-binding protein